MMYKISYTDILSDLKLTIADDVNSTTINCHKIILYYACDYFKKLLTTSFKEKNMDEITINVPNAYIVYDIIMSFYENNYGFYDPYNEMLRCTKSNICNYPDWFHLLESIKCYDYLGLPLPTVPCNITIPHEGFPLLVDIVDIICNNQNGIQKIYIDPCDRLIIGIDREDESYKQDIIEIVNNNLPPAYDLSTIPEQLLAKLKKSIYYNIVSSSWDKNVKIWNSETGDLLKTFKCKSSIADVCFSHDQKKMVCGCHGGIEIWDLESGSLLHKLEGHDDWISSVTISQDNMNIVSGSYDKMIKIWDLETGTFIKTMGGHTGRVNSVAISPDNKRIVSGSCDKTVRIWDFKKRKVLNILNGHDDSVSSVCISPDNKKIVSGGQDHSLIIWDMDSGTLLNKLNPKERVDSVAISPDNQKIVAACNFKGVLVWDLETGNLIHKLKPGDSIISVCVSPDNKKIISGSWEYNVHVWDLESGKLLKKIGGHKNYIYSVCTKIIPNNASNVSNQKFE